MTRAVTIVMYHYVRAFERTRYPRIKGLHVDGFRRQLDHLAERFRLVGPDDVLAATAGEDLPDDAALLTFDDGYAEHYDIVFPILHDRGLRGAFFAPVDPVRHHRLLDVNRIHFVLACADDPARLGSTVDAHVRDAASEFGLDAVESYRARWAIANRFDDAETIYVKRMLQTALPHDLRERIAADLFATYVSADEAAFADELYLSEDQAKVMVADGMHFGSHGTAHTWLNRVPRTVQEREVDDSIRFLDDIGMSTADGWSMCYPYGGWDESLLDVLRERNCRVGFTTDVDRADLAVHDPLLLPRFDTNDFPQ